MPVCVFMPCFPVGTTDKHDDDDSEYCISFVQQTLEQAEVICCLTSAIMCLWGLETLLYFALLFTS